MSRNQTKQKNYRFVSHNSRFDFHSDSISYGSNPPFYELHFRIIKFPIDEGQYEVPVTNSSVPFEEIKKLYARRWGIETSFRNLKYSIRLPAKQ
ncbi:transposase [Streptococcus sp. 121]|uniref:transposase n=1 Tax=Streptococcus sp. 121 TaxID=2797637 RepID=UPI0018F0FF8A|nr:transposase [Streptococcus sp. 121]